MGIGSANGSFAVGTEYRDDAIRLRDALGLEFLEDALFHEPSVDELVRCSELQLHTSSIAMHPANSDVLGAMIAGNITDVNACPVPKAKHKSAPIVYELYDVDEGK
ncbi:MAG: hypothetical protein HYT82_02370 [Candidatus Harrisonbacteria bacterium]|nr:hypothetical protein [Candidatus Harrisonbacteria bacterium]